MRSAVMHETNPVASPFAFRVRANQRYFAQLVISLLVIIDDYREITYPNCSAELSFQTTTKSGL